MKSSWIVRFNQADKASIRNDIVVVVLTGLAITVAGLVVTGLFSLVGSDDDETETDSAADTDISPAGAVTTSAVVDDCSADPSNADTVLTSAPIGDSVTIEVTSCAVTVLRVPVRENGSWLTIQVLCGDGPGGVAAPLAIEPDSSLDVVWNPAPVAECNDNPVFGEVFARTYEFRFRPLSTIPGGEVKVRAMGVKPPNEERHLDRTVLPLLPTKLGDTFGGTLHPASVHAHPIQIEAALELAVSPACPLDQAITTRIVDSSADPVFERSFAPGDCDIDWLTPELSAEDRYELQVFADDPLATVLYRMNTLLPDS